MAKYTEMTVCVTGMTDHAAQCVFHEDMPEETEIWVPLSLIEDPSVLDDPDATDADGNITISVAKWFLKKNDIPYDSDPRDPDER